MGSDKERMKTVRSIQVDGLAEKITVWSLKKSCSCGCFVRNLENIEIDGKESGGVYDREPQDDY